MRRIGPAGPFRLLWIAAALLFFAAAPLGPRATASAPPPPRVVAAAAVLMDAGSGRILYEKEAHRQLYPASITKIMTALVALEHASLDEIVTVPPEAARVEGSKMHLLPGEEYTLEELLYGLMLVSGNDAAVAIASHVAGSVFAFAELMNQTARRLGARSTHFTNPHGLPDPNHVTTAYDMALITRAALRHPVFRTIVATRVKELPARPGRRARTLPSGNWMLGQGGIDGVKTGYTRAAQHTYVATAERDGRRLIAVVMRTAPKAQKWRDALQLLDYGFSAFIWQRIVAAGELYTFLPVEGGAADGVYAVINQDVFVPLAPGERAQVRLEAALPESIAAPVAAGAVLGHLDVYVDVINPAGPAAHVDLVAAHDVAARSPSWWERLLLRIKGAAGRILP